MQYEFAVLIFAGLVSLLLILLKTNAGVVFFSACAGSLLASQLGSDASLISSSVISNQEINKSVAYILLVILPVLLSAVFMRGSVSTAKLVINLLPSVATGLLLALLIVPLLPGGVSEKLVNQTIWSDLQSLQPVILVVGVISSVIMLWLTQKNSKHKKRR